MYSLEILLATTGISSAAAALITYYFYSNSSTKKQAMKLEEELKGTREAFDAYRQNVLDEYNETASKFRTLNSSYVDLHEQLARSANTLCGEAAANTLLEAPIPESKFRTVLENTTPVETVKVEFESDTIPVDETSELTGHGDNSAQPLVKH